VYAEVVGGTPEEAAESGAPTLRSVFRDHVAFVWRTLRHLGVDDAELDDCCQEVFLVVHRRLSGFEGRSSMRTWLYAIARRVASQHRRRHPRRREAPLDHAPEGELAPAQVEAVHRRQARERLYAILDELPEDQRAVYVLYEIEQVPMREVAESMGTPLQTAYSRLHAARDRVNEAVDRMRREES